MQYQDALVAMKQMKRVARKGWNGKKMWICIGMGQMVGAHALWNAHTKAFAETMPDKVVEVLPYFIMKTADNKILMGWLASQTDMLADDWEVLPDEQTIFS